ncbi:MAG TPA: SufD family Fe-S cluster assembly protein [Candidatus Limnocylindrales bacterium]|nr:SufD family Fe-S cluster assembly protein [Candidatus Limnocylindrales bacterium]
MSDAPRIATAGGAGPAGRSGRLAEIAPSAPPARQARASSSLLLREGSQQAIERLSELQTEPDWLRAERREALQLAGDLPLEANPLFTSYVDLRAARFDEIDPYLETGDAAQMSDVLPEGAEGLLVVSDDRVVARALSPAAQSAGVVLDTLPNVLRERADLAAHVRALVEGSATLPQNDKFAQVARALSALGLVVHVPAGVRLEQPIVIRWAVGQPGRGLISRTLISLGEGAAASILEEQLPSVSPAAGAQSLWWGTSEVVLARGASLDFAAQQDFAQDTLAFVNRHATLGQEAQLRWALASVGGQLHKSRIDNQLVGRGSGVNQVEIGFGGGSQLFDLTSYTRHIGEDTSGDLLSKGVFLDRSRGYFKGLIDIERSARGTDSFLGEFAMLLTKKARSVTIPSLEIDQPDVRRASHSSSVGPIDETQVFYLMSRGLPRELARKFIVMGFLEPVVARIPLAEAQDRLRELLEQKWPADSTVATEPAA